MLEPVRVTVGNRRKVGPVRRIAAGQHGVVARRQLLTAGIGGSVIDRAVRAGKFHRIHRGVYAAVAPELLTEEGHLVAALLAAGDGALLSHGTAAWRWRIIPAPPSMITLAVPRDRGDMKGVTVFVSRNLRPGDTTR
ncbi:MAG TPA: type IV toxin-antitoxin system AbiEi family antitoxin domain-containing protein, partial [Solirubrobacteraceae bacterium]